MTISPELAAVAHAAANLATARNKSARLGKEFDVVSDHYRAATSETARAWAEYEAACNVFAASLAG